MKKNWFQWFKYSVYLFLCANIFLFLRKEWLASFHRFPDGVGLGQVIEAYASTIDTASWFFLLMLFELETYTLSDEELKGNTKWALRIVRGFCYVFILYSFWGYVSAYTWLLPFEAVDVQAICDLIGQSWMIDTDTFEAITKENCRTITKSEMFFKYAGENIYTDGKKLNSAYLLAWTGIINSLSWILVVIVLEIDVWLQWKEQFKGKAFRVSKYSKNILYSILFIAAVFWGISGKFLDFWDAFMWIVAFFFIENNLLEWKEETVDDGK